ncbi:NDR1/HIN1-like protein 6 [Abrus precatorius]|uniref:NDR1/HIN1-like protein 6 n=1 Tax=Abrus precatorius TaxID=3816 RepID=A0A8B8KJ85_ABRPR|nr:NDR1/HIN1-like protein 6 [Abrus precatorius]
MATLIRNTTLSRSRKYKYEPLTSPAFASGSGREKFLKSISYRRRRAKQRKIFLTTYKLSSLDSFSPQPNSRKLKRVALKLKKFVASFLKLMQTAALFYLLKPHIPSYNIDSINVKGFDFRKNNKIYSDIAVVVKAENPNEEFELDYLDNEVRLMYSGSQLCEGGFPPFLQPGKNTTTVNVELKGESDFDSEMQHNLMNDQKAKNIPLLITVKLPIRVVVDDMVHLRKFVVYVNCSLVIDQLEPNKTPSILSKDFTYEIEF